MRGAPLNMLTTNEGWQGFGLFDPIPSGSDPVAWTICGREWKTKSCGSLVHDHSFPPQRNLKVPTVKQFVLATSLPLSRTTLLSAIWVLRWFAALKAVEDRM